MLHKFGFNIQVGGWEKLSTRREVKKICMFYKLNVGNSPELLCDLIPPSVGETNNYNLRNRHNISQTTNRLSISQQSFFPSTTKLCNLLDLRIRQLSSFDSFKYKLKQHYYKNATPPPPLLPPPIIILATYIEIYCILK